MPSDSPRDVLVLLNSLSTTEIGRVLAELERAGRRLEAMGHGELAERLGQARRSLASGDVAGFRRAVAQVTARLGHLK